MKGLGTNPKGGTSDIPVAKHTIDSNFRSYCSTSPQELVTSKLPPPSIYIKNGAIII